MLDVLAARWWVVLLRGLAAIAFGVIALFWPGITVLALVFLFGIYAVIDGVTDLVAGIGGDGRSAGGRGLLILMGVLGIAAGIIAFVWPGITTVALLWVIAIWAIVTGILEIIAAIRLRAEIDNEWWLGLSGLLSVALGVILIVQPAAGALALVLWIGILSIAWGIALTVLAFRVRGVRGTATPAAA